MTEFNVKNQLTCDVCRRTLRPCNLNLCWEPEPGTKNVMWVYVVCKRHECVHSNEVTAHGLWCDVTDFADPANAIGRLADMSAAWSFSGSAYDRLTRLAYAAVLFGSAEDRKASKAWATTCFGTNVVPGCLAKNLRDNL